MVDRRAELRSSDEAATLPPNRGIHRIRTHEVRPKGKDRPEPIRTETGGAGRQTPQARQRSCRPINGLAALAVRAHGARLG